MTRIAERLRSAADYADETTVDNAVEPALLREAADAIDELIALRGGTYRTPEQEREPQTRLVAASNQDLVWMLDRFAGPHGWGEVLAKRARIDSPSLKQDLERARAALRKAAQERSE